MKNLWLYLKKWEFALDRLLYASGSPTGGAPGKKDEDKDDEEKEEKKDAEKEKKEEKREAAPAPSDEKIAVAQKSVEKNIRGIQETLKATRRITPESDKAQFEQARGAIERVNTQDHENNTEMRGYLNELVRTRKLTAEQAEAIYQLEPTAIHDPKAAITEGKPGAIDAAGFEKKLQKLAEPLKGDKKVLEKLFGYKRRELELMREFQKQLARTGEIIQRAAKKVNKEAYKEMILERASIGAGITMKAGTELEYKDHGIVVKQTFPPIEIPVKHTKITDITWEEESVVDGRDGEVVKKVPILEPKIHVEGENPMNLGRFMKWVDEMEVTEKIESRGALAQTLGLSQYGIALEEGMEIEYVKYGRDKEGRAVGVPERVKVAAINGNKIILDKEVETLTDSEAAHESYEAKGRSQKELTFGEFAKWFIRRRAWKALNETELKEHLAKHNEVLNKTYERDSAIYPPIEVKKGTALKFPDGKRTHFKIENIAEDGIHLDSGEKFTPAQFWNWVRENQVEAYDPALEKKQELAELSKMDPEKAKEIMKEAERIEREAEKKKADMGKAPPAAPTAHAAHEAHGHGAGPSIGLIRQLWQRTEFVSMKDLWTFGETIVQLIVRKHERRTKGRIGTLGKNLPWVFGPEFDRMKQSAENEEVEQYRSAMKEWGVFRLRERLNNANSLDEAKACFFELSGKGHIRWDDPKLWESINKLRNKYGGPRYVKGEDDIEANIDYWWGENQYEHWFNENVGHFESEKKKAAELGKQLEMDFKGTGGVTQELQKMIEEWEEGEYVDAHKFEGLIDYVIVYGKSNAEAKMYYLMKGVTTVNPKTGLTLLSMDRIGQIEGEYLNRLPMLDFLVDRYYPKGADKREKGRWLREDFARIIEWVDKDESRLKAGHGGTPTGYNPGENKRLQELIWNRILPHEWALQRLEKGLLRNPGDMDHDDVQLFLPFAGEHTISTIAQTTMGKPTFTGPGWANGYPGYAHAMKQLSRDWANPGEGNHVFVEKGRRRQLLLNTISSFVRFDAIMDNRYEKGNARFFRLSRSIYEKAPIVDSMAVWQHQKQAQQVIVNIARAYGPAFDEIFRIGQTGCISRVEEAFEQTDDSPEGKQKQEAVQHFLIDFDKNLRTLAERYGCDKIEEVIKATQLKGLGVRMSPAEQAAKKAAMEALEKETPKAGQEQGEPETGGEGHN